ncbi:PHA-granule associated protein 4 [Cupriavidus sp. D384]|uniref:PHA-granule associated protein 4 n=1 Tax=Cupriavidus sp. D384 TaxID=1538095 RepID=UPI000833EB2E|nr:PHA-granule associated protein 4 [Cupriavidus sp. D384]
MTTARATTKGEAIHLLEAAEVGLIHLDYETGWQDTSELKRLGEEAGIRVEYRGHESIAVKSPEALAAGLRRPKLTVRQRNLFCQFDFKTLPVQELEVLEEKAARLGDYILAGHLLQELDSTWV